MTCKHPDSRILGIAGLLALGVAILTAFSSPALADGTVEVVLWDRPDGTQGITLDTDTVTEGKVTFVVTNSSEVLEHEFLIVKTDATFDRFPMKDDGAFVDEKKLAGMERFGILNLNETKTWTATVVPGRHVLFCNLIGHFANGMRAVLEVTP